MHDAKHIGAGGETRHRFTQQTNLGPYLPKSSRRWINGFSCGGFAALRYPAGRDSHNGSGTHL